MSPFEILMLVCFGSAWPFSLVRSWTSRSTKGKSPLFLLVILLGYLAGVGHKLFYNLDGVILLYALNALLVGLDLALYARNKGLEQGAA